MASSAPFLTSPVLRVAGILLAAGAGTRFGGDKLLARLPDGTAVGRRACANLVSALTDVIAVVRPGDEKLAAELAAAGAQVTVCHDADAGMGASLAHGVAAVGDTDAVIIALADMPWIRRDTFEAVAAELRGGELLVVPRYRGRRGHPVGFGREHLQALAALGNDRGARDLIAHAARLHWIDVDDPGVLRDVDVPGDLG